MQGNFEREMCAWCTGVVGDCQVGDEFVEDTGEYLFDDLLNINDDRGTGRPCTMFGIERDWKSVLIFFENRPTDQQIEIVRNRMHTFNDHAKKIGHHSHQEGLKIEGLRMIQFIVTHEHIEHDLDSPCTLNG